MKSKQKRNNLKFMINKGRNREFSSRNQRMNGSNLPGQWRVFVTLSSLYITSIVGLKQIQHSTKSDHQLSHQSTTIVTVNARLIAWDGDRIPQPQPLLSIRPHSIFVSRLNDTAVPAPVIRGDFIGLRLFYEDATLLPPSLSIITLKGINTNSLFQG